MNPELNERLTTLLDYIGNTVKDADTFARGQAPLVAEEIVRWYIAESILGLIAAACFGSVGVWMLRALRKWKNDPDISAGLLLFGGGCVVVAIAMTCINANSLARGITQPRVIVLDYVRSLK